MSQQERERECRIKGFIASRRVFVDGEELFPVDSLRLRNHSPDGFAWGFHGSGPAQLSLAILLRFLPSDLALQWYQEFKRDFVSKLPETDFETTVPEEWRVQFTINRRLQEWETKHLQK